MKFAFDENIPEVLARGFQIFLELTAHDIEYAKLYSVRNVGDDYWMAAFANNGGEVIISGDLNIRQKPAELKALEQHELISFFMENRWSNANFFVKSAMILNWWPRIEEVAMASNKGDSWEIPYQWSWRDMRQLWRPGQQ